jgi:hypothetical protein
LDDWAKDTNGSAFDEASKAELLMFMDCTEEGGLTYVVFIPVWKAVNFIAYRRRQV